MKGDFNDSCNRSACKEGNATYFNHSTRKYYCKYCAQLINEVNRKDAMRIFGHDLCTQLEPVELILTDNDVKMPQDIDDPANVWIARNYPNKKVANTWIGYIQNNKENYVLVFELENGLFFVPWNNVSVETSYNQVMYSLTPIIKQLYPV